MKIVLAYSGGLDTSVLVHWLKEHFAAEVIDESFRGKNRLQQQRAVYAALKGKMDGNNGELHALALTTKAPD